MENGSAFLAAADAPGPPAMNENADIIAAGPPPRVQPGDDRLRVGIGDRDLQLAVVDPGLDDRRRVGALAGRIMLAAQGETRLEDARSLTAADGKGEAWS